MTKTIYNRIELKIITKKLQQIAITLASIIFNIGKTRSFINFNNTSIPIILDLKIPGSVDRVAELFLFMSKA
jgi:hypothetical protein